MRHRLKAAAAAVSVVVFSASGCGSEPQPPGPPLADGVVGFNVSVQDVAQVCIGGLAGTGGVETGLYTAVTDEEDTRVVWHVDDDVMRVHDFEVGKTVDAPDSNWFDSTVRTVANDLASSVIGVEPDHVDKSEDGDVQFVYDLERVDLRELLDPRLLPDCVDRFRDLTADATLVLGSVDGKLVSVAVQAPGRDLNVEWLFSIDTPNPLMDPQVSVDQTDVDVPDATFDPSIIDSVVSYVSGTP